MPAGSSGQGRYATVLTHDHDCVRAVLPLPARGTHAVRVRPDLTQLAEEELELVRQKKAQLQQQIVTATLELDDLRDQLAKV